MKTLDDMEYNPEYAKKVYAGLTKRGYTAAELGDEAKFVERMGKESNRRKLYDFVQERGNANMGSWEHFNARMNEVPAVESATVETEEQKTAAEAALAGMKMPEEQDAAKMPPKTRHQEIVESDRPMLQKAAELAFVKNDGTLSPLGKFAQGMGNFALGKGRVHMDKIFSEEGPIKLTDRQQKLMESGMPGFVVATDPIFYKDNGKLTTLGAFSQSTADIIAGAAVPIFDWIRFVGEKHPGLDMPGLEKYRKNLRDISDEGFDKINVIRKEREYLDDDIATDIATLLPQVGAYILSFLTGNPSFASAAVATQTVSTMGHSALDAKEAGAGGGQIFVAGILDGAIEFLSEKIPLSHWMGKIPNPLAKTVVSEATEKALQKEGNMLLSEVRKELGDKFTVKTIKEFAKDALEEGGSEAVAGFAQTFTPLIYNPDKYPTINALLGEAYNNARDGFVGGLLMSAMLSPTANYAQRKANDNRRREQGYVEAALVKDEKDNVSVVELIGKSEDGKYMAMRDNKVFPVEKSDIVEKQRFSYEDYRNAKVFAMRAEGYNETDANTVNGNTIALASKAVDDAKAGVRAALNLGEDADVDAMIAGKEFEGEAKDAVDTYLEKKAKFVGMRDKMNAARETEIAEADKSVDAVMHEDGNVYMTTLPSTGEDIFITGGKVVLDNEGYVDVNQSEGLVALMPNGKKEAIQPGNIREKVTVENVEAQKAAKRAEIDNRYNQQLNTFVYSDSEGDHTVMLVDRRGDMVDALIDGKPTEVPAKEFEAIMADATGKQPVEVNAVKGEKVVTGDNVPAQATAVEQPVANEVPVSAPVEQLPKEKQTPAPIPTEKRGKTERAAYHLVPIERTMEDLHDGALEADEIESLIDARIKEAENDVKATENKKPVIGADKDAYVAAKKQWQEAMDAAKAKLDYYNNLKAVNAEVTRSEMREAVEGVAPQTLIEQTADEFVANQLGGWIKITPESFQKETGLKAEQKQMVGVIAGKDKGGMTIEQAAETILENYGDELRGLGFNGDMQDMRDMIINILSNGNPRSYAKKGAEMRAQESVEQQRSELESVAHGLNFNSIEEQIEYEEAVVPRIIQDYTGFDEQEYFNNLAENYEYDTTREGEGTRGGSELLQGEQAADNAGVGDIAEPGQGGEVQGDVYSGGENAAPQGNQQVNGSEIPNNQNRDNVSQVEGAAEGGNAPGNGALSPAFEAQERKGGTITLHTRTEEKNGIKTTKVVAMRNGSEVSMPTAAFPVPEGVAFTDIPEGVEVIGVKELREGNDGKTSATVFYRDKDGVEGTMETKVVPAESEAKTENAVSEAEAPGQSGVVVQEATNEARWVAYDTSGDVASVVHERDGKVVEEEIYADGRLAERRVYDDKEDVSQIVRYHEDGSATVDVTPVAANKPETKKRRTVAEDVLEKSKQKQKKTLRERIRESAAKGRIQQWEKRTGVSVRVVESIDEVTNEQALEKLKAGEVVKGWIAGNEVVVYLPNIESVDDVDRTYIHEVVAHKGLKILMGKDFDKLCDKVGEMMSEEQRREYLAYIGANLENPTQQQMRDAADEYMAHLAESVELTETEKGIWQKIVDAIKKFLLGDGVKLTDKDIEKLIKASYSKLTESGNAGGGNGDFRARKVFHGSGAQFDKFDHSFMGTGEGAQAFGWGTYVTEVEGIGKQYAKAMRDNKISEKHKENAIVNNLARQTLASNNGDKNAALDELKNLLNESWSDKKRVKAQIKIIETGKFLPESKVKANLYTVEIPDDNGTNYLRWKADNNQETIDKLNVAYRNMLLERGVPAEDISPYFEPFGKGLSGNTIYNLFARELGGDKAASEFLNRQGLVGISYPANATTGGREDGARNYVIFNENDAQIESRTMFRIAKTPQEFDATQKEAVEKRGIVAPNLNNAIVNVVNVPRHDFTGRGIDAIHKAEKWANENIAKEHTYHEGLEDEFKYTIDEEAISKFLSKSSTSGSDNLGVHLAVLKELPKVIDNSIDVEIHPDYRKKDKVRSAENGVGRDDMLVHRMYGAVSIDGKVYRAKTTIHEFRDKENKAYDYRITEIELIVSGSSTSNARTNSTSVTGAKLLDKVEKSYDKGKKVLDESENSSAEEENRTRFRKANENQEIFVSNARKAVEEIKQEKATPQQWLAMIKKNGGLKAGEDKWMGLSEWLENNESKSLTKQEVLDFVNENAIKIEEVEYGQGLVADEGIPEYIYDGFEEIYNELRDSEEIEDHEEIVTTAWERFTESQPDWVRESIDAIAYSDGTWDLEIVDNYVFENHATESLGINAINSTRLDYTTEGLENKREIALVVPTVEPYNASDEVHFGDAGNGRAVAWVRFGETTDSEGNRVLVIDEIQSKRHQDGREKGYKSSEAQKLQQERDALYDKMYTIGLSVEEHNRFKELGELLADVSSDGVPDAPFEKNWQELAMKRMLRLAAEEGFDKVAWTTGEQQAERYNIGSVVEYIDVSPYKAPGSQTAEWTDVRINAGVSSMDLRVDVDGNVVSGGNRTTNMAGEKLADVVGKELADKILSTKEDTILDGESLRIGGEGMKGFYDKMLPSFVSKYTKKWGAKVGTVEMPYLEQNNVMHSVDVTPEMKESVMEGQTMFRRGDWNERVDRDGNRIGDGSSHMRYKVDEVALSYPNISYKVDESATTESVYVTYYNNDPKYSENERPKVTVRYSTHDSNAVKFGDQLRGEAVERNNGELLYRLGLKEREWIPAPSVPTQTVSKKDLENNTYEESELTERDIMLLPVGADIAEHKGKLIKGTNKLILVDKVLANNNRGYYRYSDIPEVEQQRAKQLVREIVEPFAKEKREEVEKQRPFHEMIDDLYNNENVDKSKYGMTYFHVAETPDFMASIGLSGAEFTIPFKAISTHIGKDSDHYLDADIWHSLPEALQNPFLVTKYGKDDRFRIYTTLMHDGKYVAVGVDVKRINQGRNKPIIEINSIKTVFAKTGKIGENETVVCYDERITPEQEALLNGRNFRQYPTIQELSVDKDSTSSAEMQEERTLFSKKELTPEQKKKKEALKENAKAIRRLHNVTSRYPITALRNLGFALETQEQREMHDRLFAERDAITGESKPAGLQTNPQAMTLQERITESLLKHAEQEKENVEMRLSAIRAYGRDLANVIKLMNAQKVYDRNTVRMFTDLVKMYMRNNAMDGMSSYDVMRLLNLMQRATGGNANMVNQAAVKIAEIITKEHTRQLKEIMEKQMKTGAERVNASGVVVQGGVDIIGKRILNTYKDAIELKDDKDFEQKYNDAFKKVGEIQKLIDQNGSNKTLENQLKEAQAEADAMLLAATYRNEIKSAEADIEALKDELTKKRTAAERGEITWGEYHEFAKTINSQIVQLRAQQIDAYQKVLHALSGDIYEGVQRARAFREAEAMRVQRIHDMAENDMGGVSKSAERKEPGVAGKTVDMVVYKNPGVRLVMNGLGTYENYMKYFGRDHLDGRGELFNHFITAFTEAQNKEWKESQNDFNILEAAARDIFDKKKKKTYMSIARDSTKGSGVILKYWNGGAVVERELTIGQLMYLYMTEKQTEGQMKLRNMGLTEEKVKAAVEQLPAKYKKFADFVQSKFLPQMRPRMNEVHQRMFGASMSEVENYFPLKVNKDARQGNDDINNTSDAIPSTITGSVIKRRVNVTPIDLTANAFDVLNEHIVEMEHWAAFAEFIRDNNTLINDKDFKNRVQNTKSVRYGDGETLWKNFVDTARIATGNYKSKADYLAKLMRGANAAKITFGYYTALKQLASAPAFWSDAKIWDAVWYSVNPMGSWRWAIKNLPGFEERWKGRTGGNERLGENEYSIHDSRIMKAARMVGMTPNAFVDAVVVASGARAVYKDRLNFYKKLGMTEYEADRRAKNDAAISYNETQQSGQGAYLSTLQREGGLGALLTTLFRNSQMAFQRRVVGSIVEIGKKLARGEKIREATKQKYINMGMSEEAAGKQANRDFYKAYAKDFTNLAIFGYGMNFVWALMGELPYLLFGDDEEEKEKIWETASKMGATGMFEGFSLGNFAKGIYEKHITDGKYAVGLLEAPFEGDLQVVLERFEKDGTLAGITQLATFMVEMNTGISPQRLIDDVAAWVYRSNGDVDTATKALLLALRWMKVPQSQQDKLILDETDGADAEEVKSIAEWYIKYKMARNFPLGSEDEKRVDKYANKFVETLKERVEKDYDPEDISVIYDQSSDTEKEILKKKWIEGMDERNGTNVAKSLRKEKIEELLGSPVEKAAAKALHRFTKTDPYEKMETFDDLERWYEYDVLLDVFKKDYQRIRDEEEMTPEERAKAVEHYGVYADKGFKEVINAIKAHKKLIKENNDPEWRMGEIRRLTDIATEIMKRYE